MAPEATSEHLISTNFLGEHPPDPPSLVCLLVCLYVITYTSDIDVTPLQKVQATGLIYLVAESTRIKTNKTNKKKFDTIVQHLKHYKEAFG